MKTKALKRLLGRAAVNELIISPRCNFSRSAGMISSEYLELDYTNQSGRRCLLVRSIRKLDREISALHYFGGRLVLCREGAKYHTYSSSGLKITSIAQHGPKWRGEFTVIFDDSMTLKTSPSSIIQWLPQKDFEVTRGSCVIRGSFSISKKFKETGCFIGNLSSNRFASVNLLSDEEICGHFGSREAYQMVVAFLAWIERNSAGD